MNYTDLQQQIVYFVRYFGLLHPSQTPCGQNVSLSEAHTLMILSQVKLEERLLTQHQIAKELQLEKSTVTRLVQDMERKGWVDRRKDDSDKRKTIVDITDQGLNVAKKIEDARREKFSKIMEHIDLQERESMIGSLTQLNQVLRLLNENSMGEQ